MKRAVEAITPDTYARYRTVEGVMVLATNSEGKVACSVICFAGRVANLGPRGMPYRVETD